MDAAEFADAASAVLADINALHPFREGNGRVQNAFLALLAAQAGHALRQERMEVEAFMAAMIASFKGTRRALTDQILKLIAP